MGTLSDISRGGTLLSLKGKQLKGIMWICRERRRASGRLALEDGRMGNPGWGHISPRFPSPIQFRANLLDRSYSPTPATFIFMLDCSHQTQSKPIPLQSGIFSLNKELGLDLLEICVPIFLVWFRKGSWNVEYIQIYYQWSIKIYYLLVSL